MADHPAARDLSDPPAPAGGAGDPGRQCLKQGDLSPVQRLLRPLVTAIIAGLAGEAFHSTLMLVKDASGILPGFQPYDDFQRQLGGWAGTRLGSLVPYLTGAMIWGFLNARLHPHLPDGRFRAKGLGFALIAWGTMSTWFLLLAGHGLFRLPMGSGIWPALFMLPMEATFRLALSFTHSRLRHE